MRKRAGYQLAHPISHSLKNRAVFRRRSVTELPLKGRFRLFRLSNPAKKKRMNGQTLVGLALALVLAILLAGLYALLKGGGTSKIWSNRLMRYRVLAQFAAILIIGLALYLGAG